MNDDIYLVEIIRDDLAGYTNRVANEEAGASEFVDNRVSVDAGIATNHASFKVLPPGQLPDPPTFVKLGSLPAGKQPSWTGVLLIAGLNVAAQMFR